MREAEQSVIGATHAEIGAYLLGLWGLPDNIVEAVAFHHIPVECMDKSFSPLTAVHVANALQHKCGKGDNGTTQLNINLEYLDNLGLINRLSKWQEISIKSKQKRGPQ